MTPDPRHGTVAGYNRIPCRDDCCRLAMANYKKRWAWDRHNGRERIVSTLGTRRRLESLAWLGWSRSQVAARVGIAPTNVARLLSKETMTASLAARFAAVFEELCMTLPTGKAQAIANTRNQARKRGAHPPLAWDDIDNDPEPRGIRDRERRDLLTEWAELQEAGESIEQAARRLGVTVGAIEKARERRDREPAA